MSNSTASRPGTCYEICVQGALTERWSGWLEGLSIRPGPGDTTLLRGVLADQSALLGVLNKIHALNLTMISVFMRPQETLPGNPSPPRSEGPASTVV